MKQFIALCIAVAMTCVASLSSCKRAAPPSPRSTPDRPRIVSLAPSITETVCALGAGDQLVGRSSACDYPPDVVNRLPVVGGFGVPSLEKILTVKPDLVLFADMADNTMTHTLERAGLASARVRCTRLDDIPPAIRLVGSLLHRETSATALAGRLEQAFRQAREQAPPPSARPTCLVLIWHDPLTAAGRNSFLSDLVALAGGRNIGDNVNRDYFQVSGEWLLAHDPDVIICCIMAHGTPARDMLMNQPTWSRLKAVRAGRVFDGLDNSLILRPGPRVLEGLAIVKRCIATPPAAPVVANTP